MAEILPVNFPIPGENIIVTYSYTDIAEGTGIHVFYMAIVKTSATTIYKLVGSTLEGTSSFNDTTAGGIDFDVSFNTPKTIKGTAYLTGKATISSGTHQVDATIIHYDGSTETVIGANTNSHTLANGDVFSIPFTIAETHFKSGDTLRLAIRVTNSSLSISANPTDSYPTKLYIPFELNL